MAERNAGRDLDRLIGEGIMGYSTQRIPRFSRDIGAAMTALAYVGGIVTIKRMASDDWRVTISGETVWAETLPLAICRALVEYTGISGGVPAGDASDPEETTDG